MTNSDPFKAPPGPVSQYVERALRLANKHRADLSLDMKTGIEEYLADIQAQASALRPEADGPAFLAAVRGRLLVGVTGGGTPEQVANDPGLVRRADTVGLIIGRLR